MTATPDQIPSDLVLEIGDDISPERFIAAVRAFFGYVNEVARSLAPGSEVPTWVVKVREGSSLIGVEPTAATAPNIVQAIYAKAENGFSWLAKGNVEDSGLPEPAIGHLHDLSKLTEGTRSRHGTSMRLWVKHKPLDVEPKIAEAIREDWRADYKDFGTVEGRLEAIQDDGRLQLRVRDVVLHQTIRCYFPEEMLPEAFGSFRKRVEISGIIHYRKNGTPISIDVSHIEPLLDDSELPSPDDVRGILRTAT